MTFKCGPCGESDGTKKAKCPETKKESGFSKKPCNANNKTKPKCHPSVEKFKSGNGSKSAGDDQKRQCTSTSQDCHESQKKFLQKETCHENKTEADCGSRFAKSEAEDCTKSEEKVINPCSQQTEEPPCSNASRKLSSIKQKLTCGSSPQSKNKPPCSNAYQKLSPNTQQEGECGSSSSLYSKITSTCKDLAKDFVKFKQSKPACPKDSLKYPLQNLPPTTLPCPPKAEKGSDKNGSLRCSGAKVSSGPCPDKKPPSWTDFFPLDARNDELNACIEKYSKIDPNKVISKCSQFANVTVDDTEKCIKKTQERCVGAMPSTKTSLQKPMLQIPLKYRALMGRWAPSAAVYLSSTALFTLYLTEWKPLLRYVPLYASYVQELEQSESKTG